MDELQMLQRHSPFCVVMSKHTWFNTANQRGEDVVEQDGLHYIVNYHSNSVSRAQVWTEQAADVWQPASPRRRTCSTRQLADMQLKVVGKKT